MIADRTAVHVRLCSVDSEPQAQLRPAGCVRLQIPRFIGPGIVGLKKCLKV